MRKLLVTFSVMLLFICLSGTGEAAVTADKDYKPIAEVNVNSNGIYLVPKVGNAGLAVTVSCPDGKVFTKIFENGGTPYIGLSDDKGNPLIDGSYTYELKIIPALTRKIRKSEAGEVSMADENKTATLIQNGYFRVQGGSVVTGGASEAPMARIQEEGEPDYLIYDDLIVTGSICVGFDCADGESFGFDTIILKEHNLRIYFNDTSYTASYPTNAWRITINDSTNGGGSYFSIDDVDDGTSPFRVEAGAPSYSLYVEDYGRVGIGTSTPVVELHVKDSDTPTLRLEQDSSGGWTAQTWDVAGNESNFFIRDATNGSKLPFRIQPSTPSSTLCLKSDGKVGMGTWSPAYSLEVETTGEDAIIVADRTDGGKGYITGGSTYVFIGSVSSHPLRLVADAGWRMQINSDNSLEMRSGASCTTAGVWTNNSSIQYKENVQKLTFNEAMGALKELNPVKFNYKVDKEDQYVGFIAEEVPELVATKDRKGMSTMDVVGVLTKVVQEQQKIIDELQKEMKEIKKQTR